MIAFSANPEDYTNRGRIITPLKDRIDSQIITHYPKNIETGIQITKQEAWQNRNEKEVNIPHYIHEIIENIAKEARESELVDQKSGVSARLSISSLENVISNAERRAFLQNQNEYHIRICDLQALIPAITGKIELVYEGEQEGVTNVAKLLVGKAIKTVFNKYFPLPDKRQKQDSKNNEYDELVNWFSGQKMVAINSNHSDEKYIKSLQTIKPLDSIVKKYFSNAFSTELGFAVAKEFVLESLHQSAFLSKYESNGEYTYKDLVETIFDSIPDDEESDLNYYS